MMENEARLDNYRRQRYLFTVFEVENRRQIRFGFSNKSIRILFLDIFCVGLRLL
jgi:hypothetical protein